MALTKEQLIQLQGSAKARKLFAIEFSKAFAAIHRSYPNQNDFETNESYNQAAEKYNREIGVKSKLEQAIDAQGVLNIFACNMLLSALSTYDGLNFTGETEDGLIDRVIGYQEDSVNIIWLECTKLLKGWTFSAAII